MPKLTRSPFVSSSSRSLTGADPAGAIPRFAAVSPTSGRLFEGTDPDTAGQTTMSRLREEQQTQMSRLREEHTVHPISTRSSLASQPSPALGVSKVSVRQCFRTVGQPTRNLLTSANAVSTVDGPRQPNRSTHNEVRVHGRLLIHPLHGSRQNPDQHLTPSDDEAMALSCPHLWITMWTAIIVLFVDPRQMTRGFLVVDS
jgi:hypothetical protein